MIILLLILISQTMCQFMEFSWMRRNVRKISRHRLYQLKRMNGYFTLPLAIEGIHYDMLLDSGSSDFMIKGQNSPGNPFNKLTCPECMSNIKQMPAERIPKIAYVDGTVTGYFLQSVVSFSRYTFNQHIFVAFKTQGSQNLRRISGILGLGFQEAALNPNPNFMSVLKNQQIIKTKLFGVVLNLLSSNRSFISFGRIQRQLMAPDGEIVFYDVIRNSDPTKIQFFQIELSGILIGMDQLPISRAIFDTGSTCLIFPKKHSLILVTQFNRGDNFCYFLTRSLSQFQILACTVKDFTQFPIITLKIGNEQYNLSKQYYISNCEKRPSNLYYCFMCIQTSSDEDITVGATFYQKYYSIFDQDRMKLGIVRSNQSIDLRDLLFSSK